MAMDIFVLNTGGTLGMIGTPLRPAKSAAELFNGIPVPAGIDLALQDLDELRDSTNVTHADRIGFARHIERAYERADAFVVLHGTDSMAETGAVLSLVFQRTLEKPIVLVGAQLAHDEPGTDTPLQLANALRVAHCFIRHGYAGVWNVSMNNVWDASRLCKRADADYDAFYTPGRGPTAKVWPTIRLLRQPHVGRHGPLTLDDRFASNVATLRVSADTPPTVLDQLTTKRTLDGVILECKGAGNIPDRTWNGTTRSWIDAINNATREGTHVALLSPFPDGRVNLARYELGQKAAAAGALSLESLAPAMADAKFRHAIATRTAHSDIQAFLSTNIVGELLDGIDDE